MKPIKFIDMTLRQAGLSSDNALTFKEKLEIARLLDRLKVDIIELPAIRGGKADQLSNKTIASLLNTAIAVAIDIGESNVEETWESIRSAGKPRLNVVAPVSPVQMEYTAHKKAPAMLEAIRER